MRRPETRDPRPETRSLTFKGAALMALAGVLVIFSLPHSGGFSPPTAAATPAFMTAPAVPLEAAAMPEACAMLSPVAVRMRSARPGPSASNPEPMMRRAAFTWTGASSGQDFWNESANWSGAGVGYPDDSSDDATFNGCGFRAEFDASRTIDDLTVDITGDFCLGYFDANGSEYTLTCDTVTITGGNDAVYVVEKAGIETN